MCSYSLCQKRETEVARCKFFVIVVILGASIPNALIFFFLLSAASLSPSVSYGRLEQFTELVVSPKSRDGIGRLSSSVMKTSEKPHFHGKQKVDHSSPPGPFFKNTSPVPHGHQWGGIADLKSLLRHMINGDPVKELPPVPDIPALLTDSVYRVCAAPPNSLCTISQVTSNVVHVFPLSHETEVGLAAGQSSVTYGLLSKVPSPKESRERVKQAMEKKKMKNSGATQDAAGVTDGGETKDKEALVVRVVCHGAVMLAGQERCYSKGDIHSGRVWVSVQKRNTRPYVSASFHISLINIRDVMVLSILQYCGDRSVLMFLWIYDVFKREVFKAKSVFGHSKAEQREMGTAVTIGPFVPIIIKYVFGS